MYELLVLSLLMHWPLHAYRIVKIANEIVGPEEVISKGTLSALLARLERDGLIKPARPNTSPFRPDRPSRVFAITPAGRARFTELMMDTASPAAQHRKLFHVKALHLEFLPPEQQLALVERYVDHCRQILGAKRLEQQADAADADKRRHMSPDLRQASQRYMRLKLDQWKLELEWAEALRAESMARL